MSFTPTFFLRKVDPVQLVEDYHNGKFNHRTLATPIRVLRDKGSASNLVLKLLDGSDPPVKSSECDQCRIVCEGISMGVPVRMQEINCITTYYMDGSTKHLECALTRIKRDQGLSIRYRDPLYMDSEQLLRRLYKQLFPEEGPLKEAPDYRLLAPRGPISTAEFLSKVHTYYQIRN